MQNAVNLLMMMCRKLQCCAVVMWGVLKTQLYFDFVEVDLTDLVFGINTL